MIVYRYPHNGKRSYLRVSKHEEVTIIEAKKFPKHGNLVNQDKGGNGYHGNCENCGLALVTDLGYNSWEGTKCEVEREEIVDITYTFYWERTIKRATKLSEEEAKEHFNTLIHKQGWGKYCFGILEEY